MAGGRCAATPLAAARVDDGAQRFHFDPLGTDQPLFGFPRTEEEITHLAEPFDVPLPLSRRWLSAQREHDTTAPDKSCSSTS